MKKILYLFLAFAVIDLSSVSAVKRRGSISRGTEIEVTSTLNKNNLKPIEYISSFDTIICDAVSVSLFEYDWFRALLKQEIVKPTIFAWDILSEQQQEQVIVDVRYSLSFLRLGTRSKKIESDEKELLIKDYKKIQRDEEKDQKKRTLLSKFIEKCNPSDSLLIDMIVIFHLLDADWVLEYIENDPYLLKKETVEVQEVAFLQVRRVLDRVISRRLRRSDKTIKSFVNTLNNKIEIREKRKFSGSYFAQWLQKIFQQQLKNI